jgi:hypothetical protein
VEPRCLHEPHPELADAIVVEPDGDLCIGHGSRRDERGVCVACGRKDLYRPGLQKRRPTAA